MTINSILTRRQFLYTSGFVFLLGASAGCQSASNTTIHIEPLKGSVSPQLLKLFRQAHGGIALKLTPREQLQVLFEQLVTLSQGDATSNRSPDLMTLGSGWYQQAIAQNLIQPLPLTQLTTWPDLAEPWLTFLRRNDHGDLNPNGQLWGQPYRWGTTLLVYRKDKLADFDWIPEDWDDLTRPELTRKISLLNQPREVLGALLKQQGHSYNEQDPRAIAALETPLRALHQNTLFYSSTSYLQPLINGDTWLAQGWSQDVVPLLNRYPNLGAVVPASGTAISADLWVQPRQSQTTFETLQPLLEFCWQAEAIQQIARSSAGISPLIYAQPELAADIRQNSLLYVTPGIFENSEIIITLPTELEAQYRQIWQTVRRSQVS